MKFDKPEQQSLDVIAMLSYWTLVDTLREGTEGMRAAGKTYLPQNPGEDDEDYADRVKHAVFTDIFSDTVSSIASRPFSKDVTVEDVSDDIESMLNNVDGAGASITAFASEVFEAGISYGVDFVLVEMPRLQGGEAESLRAFRQSGVRPYLVPIRASDVLSVKTATVAGEEVFTEFRYSANFEDEDGTEVTCVRAIFRDAIKNDDDVIVRYDTPQFEVYQKAGDAWAVSEEGELGIDEIPVVPFLTGRRVGSSWRVRPPMRGAAELQVEHYQQDNQIKYSTTQTAFPIYVAVGVDQPIDPETKEPAKVKLGPGTFVFLGKGRDTATPDLKVVQPSAESLDFMQKRLDKTEAQIRELGRQPLTAGSNNITVIAASFASQKANSAAQQWAMNLKGTIENCIRLKGKWIGQMDVQATVNVHTDFAVLAEDDKSMDWVDQARDRGDISGEQWAREAKRRGLLEPDYEYSEDDAE